MNHELKCLPEFFEAVIHVDRYKRKRVEVRREDRKYNQGDVLILLEYDVNTNKYTGRWAQVYVTHCLRGRPYVPDGYVAMSIHLQKVVEKGEVWNG
jgi:hypothetical protein